MGRIIRIMVNTKKQGGCVHQLEEFMVILGKIMIDIDSMLPCSFWATPFCNPNYMPWCRIQSWKN